MHKPIPGTLLASVALLLACHCADAARPFVSLAIGQAFEEIDAAQTGVNHPTRCDRLLYTDPASAPADGACADNAARQMFGGSFDFGAGTTAAASAGYAWDRVRLEAEFMARSHGSEAVPALPPAGNQALASKQSEWNPHSPPNHRVSAFDVRHLMFNAHYTFDTGSVWKPFAGVGAGLARVQARYFATYHRRTVADGYVEAAGGDPDAPADWQLAAAGTDSVLDADFRDTVFGYQILAGLERALDERTVLFAMLRQTWFDTAASSARWATVRSHAAVRADGVTPFRTEQAFDQVGGVALTAGLRRRF